MKLLKVSIEGHKLLNKQPTLELHTLKMLRTKHRLLLQQQYQLLQQKYHPILVGDVVELIRENIVENAKLIRENIVENAKLIRENIVENAKLIDVIIKFI
jgi:putative ribosome biogenesis GTPase RsgA